MTRIKNLSKRGLALLVALVMCLGMLNLSAAADEGHTHNADGWTCTQGESTRTLVCDKHVHNDECYETQKGELTCEQAEHVHGDGCYTQGEAVLDCGQTEHTHGEECYGEDGNPVCTQAEHTHDSGCYTQGEAVLTCTETAHTHGDGCYAVETVKTCTEEDHQHTDDCYETVAGEWTCTAPKAEETKPEAPAADEVPAEVQEFLDAVAAIPEEITPENAVEVAEYVYGPVSDAYAELLGTEYEERADVLEAVEAYAAAIEAVDFALNMESISYSPASLSGITIKNYIGYHEKLDDLDAGAATKWVGESLPYNYCPTDPAYCGYCGNVLVELVPDYYAFPSPYHAEEYNASADGIIEYKGYEKAWYPLNRSYAGLQFNYSAKKPGTVTAELIVAHGYKQFYATGYCDNRYCQAYARVYNDSYYYNLNPYWYQTYISFDVTVNARYQLNYDTQGGSTVAPTYTDKSTESATLTVTSTTPTKTGYTFKGWSETQDGKTPAAGSYTLNWSEGLGGKNNPVQKTLYAVWEETPVLKNPTVSKTPSEEYPVVGEKFSYTITVSNPNSQEIKVNITDTLNEKLTFVFTADGGTHSGGTVISGTTEKKGGTVTWTNVTVPANGSKTVTLYVKANETGQIYNEAGITWTGGSTSGNTTVTAKEPTTGGTERTFKLIYHNEPGAGWMPVEDSAKNGFLDMPEWVSEKSTENPHTMMLSTSTPRRDGYTFEHWQWGGDANATFDPGDTITLTANPETQTEVSADLYAIWTKNPDKPTSYKLIYDANGGTIRSNGDSATTMTDEIGYVPGGWTFTVKTAPEQSTNFDPTWAGHTLLGWSDTANGTVQYKAGDKIKLDENTPTKTIYAVWQANPVKPDAPQKADLDGMKLGVKIVCDVQGSGHAATSYKFSAAGFTAGAVTANTGANKDQYPYTCTVSITVAQQNKWLEQKMQDKKTLWNQEHKLLDNAQELSVPLYWNGESWTDLDTSGNWHYMVIHTTHKPHTVTVNYVTDGETPVSLGSITYTLAEGGDYDHSVGSGTTVPTNGGADVRSPKSITKDGTTYAYDPISTTDTLKGAMGSEDVTITVVYSPDNKGTNPNDPTDDTSDGIPDKYQAKVVYTAAEGGSQNGVNTYATIMKGGKMATEGTISIAGAKATANSGYYFENWTARATGHDGWTYGPSTNATLAGFSINDAKGGAVYTFTANFAAKTALTIEIVGNTATRTYNGSEQSVTGYTVKTTLPANVSVELATGKTAEAKGTAVDTYSMGLAQDSFVLTGANAGKYTVTFTVTDGWLKITPRDTALSVSAGDVTTTYDGQEHPVTPVVTLNGTDVTDDPGVTVTVVYKDAGGNVIAGEPKDAGTYTVEITAKKAGEKDATATATVKINPKELTVTTDSASMTYDGAALTAPGRVDGLVEGETVTFAVTGTQTDAGSSQNGYTLTWGTAKESNYTVTETIGTLTVNKRTLTVTTDSASKTYDGTALTAPGSISGLVDGETVTFAVTGTQTAVGNSRNGYSLTWDGTAKEGNYTVTEGTIGTLTVTASSSNDDDDDDPVPPTPSDDDDDSSDPTPNLPPEVEIEDEEPPLTDLPEEEPPLAEKPEEEELMELPEEEVPLADVPETGDKSGMWLLTAGLAAVGVAGVLLTGKKREDDVL